MREQNEQSRRRFLKLVPGATALALLGPRPIRALALTHRCMPASGGGPKEHPEPRPGIDASRVLTPKELGGDEGLIELYDGIREIPHVADGVYCYCGCVEYAGYRSLLECYEGGGMAMACKVCQGEGALVVKRHAEGQTLDQIRRAIDARFGYG